MMQQGIDKWKVRVILRDDVPDLVFWVYDNHLANVLRAVATMQFSENGLEQPQSICVACGSFPITVSKG